MRSDQIRLIVEDAICASCAVHTKRAHHRDFPEIRGEGGSAHEAIHHLISQLTIARENVQDHRRLELVDRAIADAKAQFRTLARTERIDEPSCHCDPQDRSAPKPTSALPERHSSR